MDERGTTQVFFFAAVRAEFDALLADDCTGEARPSMLSKCSFCIHTCIHTGPRHVFSIFFQLATSEDQFGLVACSVEWRHVPAKTVISWIIIGFDLINPSAPPWLFEVNFVGSWIGMHPVETAEFVSLFFSTSPGVPNRAPSIEGYSRYQGAFDQQISSRELAMNKKTIHKWVMKKILVG